MQNFWIFADKYIVVAGPHPGINAVDWVMLGSCVAWFLVLLRGVYLKVKDVKDARYLRNEFIYATALLAPIWITSKLQLIPFLFVNLGFYCIMIWASKSEKKTIHANEQIGITGNWPKNWELEAGEFRRMIPKEKKEYFQELAERQNQMGWRAEVKPLTLTLVYWLPALTASVFVHLYYM